MRPPENSGCRSDKLKALVKDLHANGIEIILDVVFNHTAEGDERGPYISYRGIDNKTYYMLTPEGFYYNFSGCGNTLNCNNPIVRNMILDCLRYWAAEYHIDGFRFDLASILGRAQDGSPLHNPPLLETLAFDPVLGKCKLIAEGLGCRRPVPGRLLPGMGTMGRMERQIPGRCAKILKRRWRAGGRSQPAYPGLTGSLPLARHDRIGQLYYVP